MPNRKKFLDNYISGALSEEDREKFEDHCFNCDACFQVLKLIDKKVGLSEQERNDLYADYLVKRNALKKQKEEKPGILKSFIAVLSQILVEKRYRLVYATAVVGAIAVLFFLIYRTTIDDKRLIDENYISERQTSTQIKPQIIDSSEIKEPEHFALAQKRGADKAIKELEKTVEEKIQIDIGQAYAANFISYPVYEYEIGDINRSSDYSLRVLSPKIGEDITDSFYFRWETGYEGPIYLEIFTNRDSLIFSESTENNQLLFTNKLNPGLYYWKLKSEDDLLYMGKFYVNRPD